MPSSRAKKPAAEGPKRILVIGSEGTIGTVLVERLKERGLEVWRTDRVKMKADHYIPSDIAHHETLAPVFDTVRPDLVYHLAGEVSREICEHWPSVATEVNVVGTVNVALLCQQYGARVVYSGSSEEYGDAFKAGPVSEHTPTGKAQGVYALTKWMAEEILEHWHRTKGLSVIVLRIFMCYGREVPNAYRSAMAQFIYKARKGDEIVVHRGGKRAWCHVDDVVEGFIRAGLYRFPESLYELFLLGNDEVVDIEDVAHEIIERVGSKSRIRFTDPPMGITPVKSAVFKKAEHLLGWAAKVSWKEGLKREVEWQTAHVPLGIRGAP